jgi:hypothetical protein
VRSWGQEPPQPRAAAPEKRAPAGLGLADGLLQELAIADGACPTAKAAPIGRESLDGPAELIGG